MKKKWTLRFIILFLVMTGSTAALGLALWWSLPSAEEIRGCLTTTMFEVRLCPKEKSYVPLNKISSHLRRAVLVAEDASFYQHDGFDWEAIQSSFEKNLAEGRYVRGGSTITQQLAKNMFLTRNKTIWRKLREALITRELEKHLKKDEILERYLNVVQFGKGLFGVKKAAQFYFKKSPSQLSLNESVFLVFLLPSPEKYSHSFFRKELTGFARKRMKTLLTTLFKGGKVSEEIYQSSLSQLSYFPGAIPAPVEVSVASETLVDSQNSQTTVPTEDGGLGLASPPSTEGSGSESQKTASENKNKDALIPTLEELEQEIEENSL